MGKGSRRRPEDPQKIAANWPFPPKERPVAASAETDPVPQAGWCATCGWALSPADDVLAACTNPACASFMELRASASWNRLESAMRREYTPQ